MMSDETPPPPSHKRKYFSGYDDENEPGINHGNIPPANPNISPLFFKKSTQTIVPGVSTPAEDRYERNVLPTSPFSSYTYPHDTTITHTALSQLGYLVTVTESGSVNVWRLGPNYDDSYQSGTNTKKGVIQNSTQYQFVVSFNALYTTRLLSVLVSPCGYYCVTVGVDGVVFVMNLKSLSIDEQFTLPFLPTTTCLLQQYCTSHDASMSSGSNTFALKSSSLSLCIGTVTGHIFIYPISAPQRSSVLVSQVSSQPLISITALPLSAFQAHLQNELKNNLTASKPALSYQFLSQMAGYILICADLQGNIDYWLLPQCYTENINTLNSLFDPNHIQAQQFSYSVTGETASASDHLLQQLHDHIIPSISLSSNSETSSSTQQQPNPVLSGLINAIKPLTQHNNIVFYGSFITSILPSPFSTVLCPHIVSKSQTDLFITRREKLLPLSATLSPDGNHLIVYCIEKRDEFTNNNALSLSSAVSTCNSKNQQLSKVYVLVLQTLTCKLQYKYIEDVLTQYPHHFDESLPLSSDLLYTVPFSRPNTTEKSKQTSPNNNNNNNSSTASTMIPSINNMLLEQQVCFNPHTAKIWENVSLSIAVEASPSSPPTCTIPNPFYFPNPQQFSNTLFIMNKFLSSLYQNTLTPLYQVFAALPTLPTYTPELKADYVRKIILNNITTTLHNSNNSNIAQIAAIFTSTYQPLIGTSHTAAPHLGSDIITFSPNSKYFYYPTIFGIKTIRFRDGFTIYTMGTSDHQNDEENPILIAKDDLVLDNTIFFINLCFITENHYTYYSSTKSETKNVSSLLYKGIETPQQGTIPITNNICAVSFRHNRLYQYNTVASASLPYSRGTSKMTTSQITKASYLYTLSRADVDKILRKRDVITPISLSSINTSISTSNSTHMSDQSISIDPSSSPQSPTYTRAIIHTNYGDITLTLFPHLTPKTYLNFISLCKENYYNNTIFHRKNSEMIQGGDPTGTGYGGESCAEYNRKSFDDECPGQPGVSPQNMLKYDKRGCVGMANAGKDKLGHGTNSSQFFITFDKTPHLNGKHTIFAQVLSGWSVLDEFEKLRVDDNDKPRDIQNVQTIPTIKSISLQ